MRFIYQYPETNGSARDMLDAGELGEVARAAERCGFMGFSFTEHPAPGSRWLESGGHQTLDPFAALAYVAALTTRLHLLTYLSVLPYRNPLLLAKTCATIDRLSGGRFVLGAGTGYLKGEFRALGVDMEERNRLFDEALDVLPRHWKGEPFSYRGTHFEARDVVGLPRPAQDRIPIWIGGNSKAALRRVAERADGWMPLVVPSGAGATVRSPALGSLSDVAATVEKLQAAAAGRGVKLDITHPYNDPSLHAAPHKDVERHKEALGALADAGVTWVVVSGSTRTLAATLEFIDGFGRNYIEPTGA